MSAVFVVAGFIVAGASRSAWTEGGLRWVRASSAGRCSLRGGSRARLGGPRAPLGARLARASSAPVAGFAAELFDELDFGDRHAALHGLHHVVHGERRDRG